MNFRSQLHRILLLCCSLPVLIYQPALADDLVSIYQLAHDADPEYQAAIATHEAALEVLPQSRAALLPNIGLRADVSRDRFDPRGSGRTSYATNQTYNVGLRQAIYQRESFVQLEQADSRIAQADAELEATQQDLILRVARIYFIQLGAQDNLEFVRADKNAIERTLDQAEQRFKVGLAAITDSLEARARFDTAVSDEINAEKLMDDAREAVRELTGQPPGVPEILQAEIPLIAPDPADKETWVTAAVAQNPLVLATRSATETAKQEIQVQRSGHYPSLDATADWSYRDNRFGGFTELKRNDSAVGLEFNLPLYQGGLVSSQTRQSRYEYNRAIEEQTKQYRATERQTRDNYRGVISGISKVKALQRAVESNEKAVEAAETGFEVGTRTIVDVLDAQRELLRARRDYARSRYDYLLDTLRLKQAAGILAGEDLVQISAWLVEPEV
jgi:outer membrane protein